MLEGDSVIVLIVGRRKAREGQVGSCSRATKDNAFVNSIYSRNISYRYLEYFSLHVIQGFRLDATSCNTGEAE